MTADPMPSFPALISQATLAALLHVRESTIKSWRYKTPTEIPYVRVGRRAFYKAEDVLAYIEKQKNQ